jgi:ribonuclease HI
LAEGGVLKIYTDGSSLGNGAKGATAGVGVYFGPRDPRYVTCLHLFFISNRYHRNLSEALKGVRQTNQRAELTAVLRALQLAPLDRDVLIYSDSNYSINCVTEWFINWRRNGWLNASGKPVENKDIIETILTKIEERQTVRSKTLFEWLKGHANDPGNEAADSLAVSGAREARLNRVDGDD